MQLHRDRHYAFRFGESRVIPRIHLEGTSVGQAVSIYRMDTSTGRRLEWWRASVVGDGGWLAFAEPLLVHAGDAFMAILEPVIRCETPADYTAIDDVNRLAFGQVAEADLVNQLRAGGYAIVSMVAEQDGEIVGHILYSPLAIHTATGVVPALALAPMAVHPPRQRQGIGSALVRRSLAYCREQGHRIVVVVGHPDYYPRFGFSAQAAQPLESPFAGSEAHMALALIPNALEGVAGRVEYAPPFGVWM